MIFARPIQNIDGGGFILSKLLFEKKQSVVKIAKRNFYKSELIDKKSIERGCLIEKIACKRGRLQLQIISILGWKGVVYGIV